MSLHEGASLIQCKIFTLVSGKHFILKQFLLQASETRRKVAKSPQYFAGEGVQGCLK